jgi:hypothetical protein
MALRTAGFGVWGLIIAAVSLSLTMAGIGVVLLIDPRRFPSMLVRLNRRGPFAVFAESHARWLARRVLQLRILGVLCVWWGFSILYVIVNGLIHRSN